MDRGIEIFRDIPEYEDYLISNWGRVKSVKTSKILKSQKQPNGYLFITLHKEKISKHKMIHRLVALVFLPPPLSEQTDVNHKDENKENNFVYINPDDGTVDSERSNLEFMSHKKNMNFGTCQKRKGELHKKPIYKILNGVKTLYPDITDAATQHKVTIQAISQCLRGKTKHAAGAEWKYA